MKTAISLPDELFRALDAKARALKLSRSGLLARAAREFLEREPAAEMSATAAWNLALEKSGQASDDPAAGAFKRRTKAVIRREQGRRR